MQINVLASHFANRWLTIEGAGRNPAHILGCLVRAHYPGLVQLPRRTAELPALRTLPWPRSAAHAHDRVASFAVGGLQAWRGRLLWHQSRGRAERILGKFLSHTKLVNI